jgi:hypothetical protein
MAGRSPQPTKVQRDVEPSKGRRAVEQIRQVATGEEELHRITHFVLCQSEPSGDAPETIDVRDVRQNRVGHAFCVCEGDHGRWAKSSLRAGRLSTSRSVIATSASTTRAALDAALLGRAHVPTRAGDLPARDAVLVVLCRLSVEAVRMVVGIVDGSAVFEGQDGGVTETTGRATR